MKGWAIAMWHIHVCCWVIFISARYSMPYFHHTEHITCSLLMLLSWGLFGQNGWMMASPGGGGGEEEERKKKESYLDLTINNCLCSSTSNYHEYFGWV
jgi:hypothetical protein